MYGFKLGQIEGLDSSVETVTLTIANATKSNTYTLTYNADNQSWTDSPTMETSTVALTSSYPNANGFALVMLTYDASGVGDTYNVTISTSTIEENFKSAVETVLADNSRIIHIKTSHGSASVVESSEAIEAMINTQLPIMVVINEREYTGFLSLIWNNLGVIYPSINPNTNLLIYNVYELIFGEGGVSVAHTMYTSTLTPAT